MISQDFNKAITKTKTLYNLVGWKGVFAHIRFWDAPYVEVEKLIPEDGTILELGCGEGLFSNFMSIMSEKRKIIGIELDRARAKDAERGLRNVKFTRGDVTKVNLPKVDTIVMFHLLHHLLSRKKQENLIRRCKKAIRKNGKLIIVEVDNKPFWKYLVSWLTDRFIVAWLFEKRLYEPNIFYRTKKEWLAVLKDGGFKVRALPMHQGKPFSHIVFICT